MTDNDLRDQRVERLRRARAADSASKTKRARDIVAANLRDGARITFASIARHAQVSTWFVYNQIDVRTAIHAAMREQREYGIEASTTPSTYRASAASLATELAYTRTQLAKAETERDDYRRRMQLALGAAIDTDNVERLRARVHELDETNSRLAAETREARQYVAELTRERDRAQDDVTAARAALKRTIRSVPSGA